MFSQRQRTKQSNTGLQVGEEGFVVTRQPTDRGALPEVIVNSRHSNTPLRVAVPLPVATDTGVPREGERIYFLRLLDDYGLLIGAHTNKHDGFETQRRISHGHSASALTFADDGAITLFETVTLTDDVIDSIDGSFTLADITAVTFVNDEEQTTVTVDSIDVAANAALTLDGDAVLTSNTANTIPFDQLVFFNTPDRTIHVSEIETIHAGGAYDPTALSSIDLLDHKVNDATVELTDSGTGHLRSRIDEQSGDELDADVSVQNGNVYASSDRTVSGLSYTANLDLVDGSATLTTHDESGGSAKETTIDCSDGNVSVTTNKQNGDDVQCFFTDGDVTLQTEEGGSTSCTVTVADGVITLESKDGTTVTVGTNVDVTTSDGTDVTIDNNAVSVDGGSTPVVTDISTSTDGDGHVTSVSTTTSDAVLVP